MANDTQRFPLQRENCVYKFSHGKCVKKWVLKCILDNRELQSFSVFLVDICAVKKISEISKSTYLSIHIDMVFIYLIYYCDFVKIFLWKICVTEFFFWKQIYIWFLFQDWMKSWTDGFLFLMVYKHGAGFITTDRQIKEKMCCRWLC